MPSFAPSGVTANVFGFVALACYAASSVLYVIHLKRPRPAVGWAATGLALLGAILNLEALYARSVFLHSVPYRDLVGSMALLGYFLVVLNLLLELRHRDRSLGPFLMPVVFLFLLVALEVPPGSSPPRAELKGPVFALHVTLNMAGYAAYAVACALAALYLWAGYSLKSRKLALEGVSLRLPSLSYLERATRTSLGVGVVAGGIGFCLGGYWASRVWRPDHPLWLLDPKVAAALVILVFYAVVLVRAHRGAAPVTTARLAVVGFLLVILSYTVVNLFASRLHVFA